LTRPAASVYFHVFAMEERTIGGKYALRREIGFGGMGVVWEAFDRALHRPVAIKLMTPEHVASADARRRFEQEAMTVARLRNEHIVQVHDYGIDEGSPYLVMELLEGEDLERRLRRVRKLPAAAVLPLLRQIAAGLDAATAAGVVHCDLKPANIFLARSAAGESVKILDFGLGSRLVEARDDDRRETRRRFGTPAYMSPEQVRGVPAHPLADLWSLGVVLYRALTGQLPFPSSNVREMIISICTDAFQRPSALDAEILPGFDALFERALAKDRTRRFQSPRELHTAFAAVCDATRGPTTILIVDDEPDVQLLLKMHFRQKRVDDAAYELVFAENGQAALDTLARHADVDVVLADIHMPVMDGLTLLGRIAEAHPLVKTVIVSAYGDMANIRRAMNLGAFDFLIKPIDLDDLDATVERTARSVAEHRRKAHSTEENDVLRRFTSPALVERLRTLGASAALASEALETTVAFVEVSRGPSSAPDLLPADVARALNATFEVILPELTAKGGVVDTLAGAAAVVVFQGPEHTARALEACLAARGQLETLARRAGEGSPYEHGVSAGVSTGRVFSGSLGSQASGQLRYTVVGEPVDAASHLARLARPGEILVSEAARRAAGSGFAFVDAGPRDLRPSAAPAAVTVHGVIRDLPAEVGSMDGSTIESTVQSMDVATVDLTVDSMR
jgi:eukaryotic-like serine/threonine-protein kinase